MICYLTLPVVWWVYNLLSLFQSWPFHQPVNKKLIKDYYDIIKKPMDLSTLLRVCTSSFARSNAQAFDLQEVTFKSVHKTPHDVLLMGSLRDKVLQNVNEHKYHNREQFLNDVELIVRNSERYNGKDSAFTETAKRIHLTAKEALMEVCILIEVLRCDDFSIVQCHTCTFIAFSFDQLFLANIYIGM